MKLNLGCGNDHREGFVSADIRALPGVEIVCDARSLPLHDGSVEHLMANDLIEHIPMTEVGATLREWNRVLEPGGILELRTPSFYKIFRAALMRRLTPEKVFELIFGDQSPEWGGWEWGGHKSGKSAEQWHHDLAASGFDHIEIMEDEHEYNFHIQAVKSAKEADSGQDQEVKSKEEVVPVPHG